ncbi:MAG TPA: hypothetical protein VE548_06440, partial [Nitrososphaeraceae archaeon]|nr:hypothetical protein [Nitrososphaeraceae archaeon]
MLSQGLPEVHMKDLCKQQLTPSNIWEILDRNNRFKATIIINFSSGDVIRIIFGFTEYVSFQINPLVSVFLCLVLLQLEDHERLYSISRIL